APVPGLSPFRVV
uniref:Bradykinin-like peptide AV-12 n=1 Tax=Ascaphus truei TaxID=8439 RepID=BRK12_ASCTR|nr:RecName: Full=Bradykinin-like peptide AV-12 [Ascaphus truei]